ncbi:MAG: hypothetical protein MJ252_12270 [archaeon]|nr:hypothetical protein [archaeon]
MEYFNEEENTDFLIFESNKIYIDYNANLFTFHKVDEEEKLLLVSLDNQEIKLETSGEEEKDECFDMNQNNDLITLQYFPICLSHSNITLCYDQDLPQVLSSELLVNFLQIFPMMNNNSLVCGYDSLGAGCVINHLHLEFLFLDDFPMGSIPELPIDRRESFPILQTKLVHKNKEEISMFDGNTLLKLSKIKYPFHCWKIEAILNQNDNFTSEITSLNEMFQNSISHLANLILSRLIEHEVPHNLIISRKGTLFYVIPRKFERKEYPINSCWNDLGGLITCKDKNYYDNCTEDDINKFFKENISLEDNDFNDLTNQLINLVVGVYETECA